LRLQLCHFFNGHFAVSCLTNAQNEYHPDLEAIFRPAAVVVMFLLLIWLGYTLLITNQ
jgi:hypothetical protein